MGFNLLVTTARGLEHKASSELFALLTSLGDSPVIEKTEVQGLLKVKTNLSPDKVILEVARVVKEEPWRIRYILRMIPIEMVVRSLEELSEAAKTLSAKMRKDETFRVTVEKRHTNLSSREVIEAVASVIDQKVDLKNPDWIVQVEIVGPEIGISILKDEQILSTVKAKREG